VALKDDIFQGGAILVAKWDYIFIDYFYIVEKRQGYGREIVKTVEKLAKSLGKKGVYLFTSTFQTPDFYKALGYTETGRIPALIDGYDEILFVKQF
jgi:GNAT superfamily N-acetyltransferase